MNDQIQVTKIISIAKLAGKAILNIYYDADFSRVVDFKSDNSPLTLADKAAHEVIVAQLEEVYPEIPIISEEGAEIPYEVRKEYQKYWLVDPLDGTKEFIKRNGEFTVNIALIENGVPVLPHDGRWWDQNFGPRVNRGRCQVTMEDAETADLRACPKCGRLQSVSAWDLGNGECARCDWVVEDLPAPLARFIADYPRV